MKSLAAHLNESFENNLYAYALQMFKNNDSFNEFEKSVTSNLGRKLYLLQHGTDAISLDGGNWKVFCTTLEQFNDCSHKFLSDNSDWYTFARQSELVIEPSNPT